VVQESPQHHCQEGKTLKGSNLKKWTKKESNKQGTKTAGRKININKKSNREHRIREKQGGHYQGGGGGTELEREGAGTTTLREKDSGREKITERLSEFTTGQRGGGRGPEGNLNKEDGG